MMAGSSSHIVLDQKRFSANLQFIRSLLDPGVTLSAVIKGNAYGHGIAPFVALAEGEGISHFSVYGMEEARAFQLAASPNAQLMIMGYIAEADMEWVMSHGYAFFVYDLMQLDLAIVAAKALRYKAKIHVEMETGMNRTGICEEDLDALCGKLKANADCLILSGVCTHFAGAENLANKPRIEQQKSRFNHYLKKFKEAGVHFENRHAACSAALLRYPEAQYDMVRVGILMYGFWPNQETLGAYLAEENRNIDPLKSIITWKSQVMAVKTVAEGEYIGYGTSYLTNKETRIAIVPVGYAYGYARSLSNHGRVLVHGQRVPVIGIVNMNMLTVDVTNIDGVARGDEVILIGFQGENRITVSSFGEMSSQLNYELLARLPHNIPRTIAK